MKKKKKKKEWEKHPPSRRALIAVAPESRENNMNTRLCISATKKKQMETPRKA